MSSPTLRVVLAGILLVSSTTTLALTEARLGSAAFFALAGIAAGCQAAVLFGVRQGRSGALLLLALAFGLACRVPLAAGQVNSDSDSIRYIWDGRVQRLGYNPYSVLPADPALAQTHTPQTAAMPSRYDRTPYPPAAQLFFRAVVTAGESPYLMKGALLACDLLIIWLLWRWLRFTGRDQWLVLAYAWSPLVLLEVAHSGHVDVLAAFWTTAAAYCLARKHRALASVAFTLAVATKFLPVVLTPLFFRRVRARDIALGVGVLAALYMPFMFGASLPIGALPKVVSTLRFNSPIFRPLAWIITPQGAAAFALAVGLSAACWARWTRDASDPAAWAWPMALALVCAPVIYPWYLVSLTPFLFSRATLPLAVWTVSILPVYIVWERASEGGPWWVPVPLMIVEYGLVVIVSALLILRAVETSARPRPAPEGQPT